MAFVADPTEEELQRALAQAGAAKVGAVGPADGPNVVGAPSGPAVPTGAAPSAAPGAEQGTGYVNLSRYFNANTAGAEKMANSLMTPLKVDTKEVGDAAASAVQMPTAPGAYVDNSATSGVTGEDAQLAADAAAQRQADYEKALEQAKQSAEAARQEAIRKAGASSIDKAREITRDPLKRDEALNAQGNGSAFDSYLTGSAIQPAYQGLLDYYGSDGRGSPSGPRAPGSTPTTGTERPPGAPGDPPARPGPGSAGADQGWGPRPAAPVLTAAASMDPQLRKRSQRAGGW